MWRMVMTLALCLGCLRQNDNCNAQPWTCASGGGAWGNPSGASGGYCTTDALCGPGLVCDGATGACASPNSGCGQASFTPKQSGSKALLLLDRSSSMSDSTSTGTKWSDVVNTLTSVLANTPPGMEWGLELFPGNSDACAPDSVSVSPASNSSGAVLAQILGTQPTGDGTPTRVALQAAGDYLRSLGGPQQPYIVLATDGEPNCGQNGPGFTDDDGAVEAVKEQAQSGISTFVIGVAVDAMADQTLSKMALAGGEARTGATAYYASQNGHDLDIAMALVSRQIGACTFDLSPPPPKGDTVDLSVAGRAFPRDTSHRSDGWDFTNGGHSIALFGAACDEAVQAGTVQVQYICATGSSCDAGSMQCVPDSGGSGGAGGTGGSGGSGGSGGTGGTGGTGGSGGGGIPGTCDGMCRYNAQCGPGGICTGGDCSPGCTTDSQCGTGDVCQGGHCVPGTTSGGQCIWSTDCPVAGSTCINGYCHPGCTEDAQCPAGDICDNNVCQPNWRRIPTCTSNAQCTGGTVCVDTICRTPCWANTDCASSPSGSVCFTGYCFQPNQANPQCYLNSDCPAGHSCVDATCQ